MDIWRAAAMVCGLALAWGPPSLAETWQAQGVGAIDEGDPRVDATLLVDVNAAVPGTTFRVGVLLRMDPGWHVYWKNSGDAGFPTEIEWTSSEVAFGALRFPAPEVFLESGGVVRTFGYTGEVLLFTHAELPQGETELIRIRAQVRFLACKERCIPGEIRLEAALPSAWSGRQQIAGRASVRSVRQTRPGSS